MHVALGGGVPGGSRRVSNRLMQGSSCRSGGDKAGRRASTKQQSRSLGRCVRRPPTPRHPRRPRNPETVAIWSEPAPKPGSRREVASDPAEGGTPRGLLKASHTLPWSANSPPLSRSTVMHRRWPRLVRRKIRVTWLTRRPAMFQAPFLDPAQKYAGRSSALRVLDGHPE